MCFIYLYVPGAWQTQIFVDWLHEWMMLWSVQDMENSEINQITKNLFNKEKADFHMGPHIHPHLGKNGMG